MTIEELAEKVTDMSKEEQKQFERDIRLLWANGSLNDTLYQETIKSALRSIKCYGEGL